jgi:hypothetical protein
MTKIVATHDPMSVIQHLVSRIEKLERQNFLNHSAIDGGTGMAVRSAGGIHLEDSGTLTADGLRIDRANGGRVKVGDAYFEGLNGGQVKVGATEVKAGGVKTGTVEASGLIDAKQGVQIPYKTGTASVGTALEQVDVKAGNADIKAGNAQTAANGAKTRADDAYALAGVKLGASNYTGMKNVINDLSARLNAIDGGTKWLLPQNPTAD